MNAHISSVHVSGAHECAAVNFTFLTRLENELVSRVTNFGVVFFGWMNGQYLWSVLVLTADAIGLVFDFL